MTRSKTAAVKGAQSPCFPTEHLDIDHGLSLADDPEKFFPAIQTRT